MTRADDALPSIPVIRDLLDTYEKKFHTFVSSFGSELYEAGFAAGYGAARTKCDETARNISHAPLAGSRGEGAPSFGNTTYDPEESASLATSSFSSPIALSGVS